MPITFYRSENDLPDFGDYNMKGHTYRYFKGDPLFAFGEGLSYSTFKYANSRFRMISRTVEGKSLGINYSLLVSVTNTSSRDGEEVVQVYLKREGDVEGPQLSLRGFKRVFVPAGQTVEVEVPIEDLRTWNPETCRMEFVPGQYSIFYGSSSRRSDLHEIKCNLKR